MKRIIYIILILCFSFYLFGCEPIINYSEEYDVYKEVELIETIENDEVSRLANQTYKKWLETDFEVSEKFNYHDLEGVIERHIIKKGNTLDDFQLTAHITNTKNDEVLGEMHVYVKDKMIYIGLASSGIESKVKCSFEDLEIESVEDIIEELEMFSINIKYYFEEIVSFTSWEEGTKSMGKDKRDNVVLSFTSEENEYSGRIVFEDELAVYMIAKSQMEEFREITFSYKNINIDFSKLVKTEYVQE